jgi:aromatic ring-opening dioxygenase catalytic subunit (LigB family)
MGTVVRGMASSHAFALAEPDTWDERRRRNQKLYEHRYGTLPADQPGVADETDVLVAERYGEIRTALGALRALLAAEKPDVLILIGDDQDENFTELNQPQFAIYVGDGFIAGPMNEPGTARASHPRLADALLTGCVEADIDLACIRKLAGDRLFGHAFWPVLKAVDPDGHIAVVPVFVNAIHMPAPSPARCYYLGQTIRRIVEASPEAGRVAIYGSGGLSHFTGGYPWKSYHGPQTHGAIDRVFDAWLIERLASGDGTALAQLTTRDLLAHGEIELRSWIVTLGALGNVKPDVLTYQPFYRGLMGMGVASWPAAAQARETAVT